MTGGPSIVGLLLVAGFLGMAFLEAWKPARAAVAPMGLRWLGNFVLFGLAGALAWLLPLLTSSAVAGLAARHGWGLFHWIPVPSPAALAASFVLLDLAGYWSHRLFHTAPLWRLHALHHSDSDLDVTTAIRHHPGEVLVQMAIDAALALLFGFPQEAILLYASVVLVVQIFHHANVLLPARLGWLSQCLITPDLHRLHHSTRYAENNSNFGNLVPFWDRLFGTLRQEPEGELRVGLAEFAGADFQRLDKLLIHPLLVSAAPPRAIPEP